MRRCLAVLVAILACLPLVAQQSAPQVTPDSLWNALLQGNESYVAGKITYDKLKEERKLFSEHQYPPVTVLSCSDSRVPPELIFNQSLGALFVVRAAGNVADTFGLASIEYAISKGYTVLIVVLGHESCGAVEASLDKDDPGSPNLLALAQRIRTSFIGIPWDPKDPVIVKRAVEANARASAANLLASSRIIREAVHSGKVRIVVAYYELESGKVVAIE